jgi:hypothetical protein
MQSLVAAGDWLIGCKQISAFSRIQPSLIISNRRSMSRDLRRKLRLTRNFNTVRVLSEAAFLELVGLKARQAALQKSYPAETVSKLLKVTPRLFGAGNSLAWFALRMDGTTFRISSHFARSQNW